MKQTASFTRHGMWSVLELFEYSFLGRLIIQMTLIDS